jgi:hypothetical protein
MSSITDLPGFSNILKYYFLLPAKGNDMSFTMAKIKTVVFNICIFCIQFILKEIL